MRRLLENSMRGLVSLNTATGGPTIARHQEAAERPALIEEAGTDDGHRARG